MHILLSSACRFERKGSPNSCQRSFLKVKSDWLSIYTGHATRAMDSCRLLAISHFRCLLPTVYESHEQWKYHPMSSACSSCVRIPLRTFDSMRMSVCVWHAEPGVTLGLCFTITLPVIHSSLWCCCFLLLLVRSLANWVRSSYPSSVIGYSIHTNRETRHWLLSCSDFSVSFLFSLKGRLGLLLMTWPTWWWL